MSSPAEPVRSNPNAVQGPRADESARAALRTRHQVKVIDARLEGSGIEAVPGGVYGFTYAPSGAAPLFAKHSYQSFEMHKSPGGAEFLIGYVNAQERGQLESGKGSVEVKVYPETYESATELVAIPFDRISGRKRPPSREAGNWLQLTVE